MSVAGYLPDHVVITGFRITPVVAFVRPGFELSLDRSEVQRTFEVPLDYIFDARQFPQAAAPPDAQRRGS